MWRKNSGSDNGKSGHYESLINPKFTHMGMAAFKNPNNQYKAITIAQTLGDDASSEELAGRYGSAVQCTEVTASNLSTVKTKATVVENH